MDVKGKNKKELIEMAKTKEGYDPEKHKKIADLRKFLAPTEKVSKKEKLIEEAKQYPDFRKTTHGRNIESLKAFLASKREGGGGAAAVVEKAVQQADVELTRERVANMKFTELKVLAKKRGWTEKTGKKVDLLAFLLPQFPEKEAAVGGYLPAVREEEEEIVNEVDLDDWPIPDDVIREKTKTIDALKRLLALKGIKEGIPRSKKEIMELLKKSRCDYGRFSCDDTEFCDLRNHLCRDLDILRDKDGAIKKFAKGLKYFDEENNRFYGHKDTIEKIRLALHHIEKEVSPPPPPSPVVVDEQIILPVLPQHKEADKLSPININKLLDKPSEDEIRKAILHCLGLYNDLDPNDEIIS